MDKTTVEYVFDRAVSDYCQLPGHHLTIYLHPLEAPMDLVATIADSPESGLSKCVRYNKEWVDKMEDTQENREKLYVLFRTILENQFAPELPDRIPWSLVNQYIIFNTPEMFDVSADEIPPQVFRAIQWADRQNKNLLYTLLMGTRAAQMTFGKMNGPWHVIIDDDPMIYAKERTVVLDSHMLTDVNTIPLMNCMELLWGLARTCVSLSPIQRAGPGERYLEAYDAMKEKWKMMKELSVVPSAELAATSIMLPEAVYSREQLETIWNAMKSTMLSIIKKMKE